MKKTLFAAALFAAAMATSALFGAETKKIPILWKAKTEEPAKFQIVAFGFLDDKEDVIFAFQIKDAAELMKLDSHLSQYYNLDNDIKTGRFPRNLGVDLQINGRIREGDNFAPIRWNAENKATDLKTVKGDKAFVRNGDVIFYILSKEALGDLKFKPQFRVNASFYVKNLKTPPKGIPGHVPVDTTKPLGEFEMPEPK
ncbi:MAG: hypothetical protein J6331_03800 [Lentisphaeria bacterium]|nr:hypothetical protein [Lentisphaeria bacterium]